MLRFLLTFVAVLLALFIGQLTWPGQRYVVVPVTEALAWISAVLLQAVDSSVVAQGKTLYNGVTGQGVTIEAGCNGVEACIVLIAALVAYPARWRVRLAGIAAGIVAIQAVNLVRIVSLFYLVQWNEAVFRFAHLYLWQALLMLDVVVVWLLWMRWAAARQAVDAQPQAVAA